MLEVSFSVCFMSKGSAADSLIQSPDVQHLETEMYFCDGTVVPAGHKGVLSIRTEIRVLLALINGNAHE